MQAFLKEVMQLKDLNQKLPAFFPDYPEELVTVDEQEEKIDKQMMIQLCAVKYKSHIMRQL